MTAERMPLRGRPIVKGFFEKRTFSIQYVVSDPETKRCRDHRPGTHFDREGGGNGITFAEGLRFVREQGLTLEWILDTHPHADHFSAAGY